MATYYVSSAGDNTTGAAWETAYTSLQTALTAATSGTDIVLIDKAAIPSADGAVSADKTWTHPSLGVSVFSVTNDGAPGLYSYSPMNDSTYLGSTGAFELTLSGNCRYYGVTWRVGGTANDNIRGNADSGSRYFEDCTFWLGSTSVAPRIDLTGSSANDKNNHTSVNNCVFRFANSSQRIRVGADTNITITNSRLHSSGTAVTGVFATDASGSGYTVCDSCDFSNTTTTATIVPSAAGNGVNRFTFNNCKVSTAISWLGTQVPTNLASNDVFVFNSGNGTTSGDTHYQFEYHNALGSCVAVTGVAVSSSSGAKYDGTNAVSWQITTTANCSFYSPFITPWIDKYHSGTSAITPSLEICNSAASAPAYYDDEVWAEFRYQGTTGENLGVVVSDRMSILGSRAAQTTGELSGSDWSGENATSWYGKLHYSPTLTPLEIGMLSARVCVGVPSSVVYVDPVIRT